MARVSKTWFDVAVGLIWKEIPDILHLLEILAPLTFEDDKVVCNGSYRIMDQANAQQ